MVQSPDERITVLIPTSPIPSHPSTNVIERAVASIRRHLPRAQIFVMFDSVRKEQEHYREVYLEYIRRVAEKALREWGHTRLFPHREFLHQAEMTRRTLESVTTPLILFMEHDTFFVEGDIDWSGIADVIQTGAANMVMFHCQWEPWVIPEHEHLMLDSSRKLYGEVPMIRTWQWSQRPHVASADFYRHILKAYFRPESRTMIEDRMYEIVTGCRHLHGDDGWKDWKLMYYAPEGSIRRTWTVDGRAGDPKFPMTV